MKILIFNWRDIKNPEGGGAEVFTHENAKRWVKSGNKVTIFTSAFEDCKKEETIDGVQIVRAGWKYSVYSKAKTYYEKFFSHERFDVIIDEINTRPFFTPRFVNQGEKIVVLIHQLAREFWFYETRFPINFVGYHFLEDRWLKRYRNLPAVAVSDSTKNDLVDLGFRNVFVVSEGLTFKPLRKISEKEEEPVIIYVGRLKRAKRPDHVVKAFSMILEQIPRAKLWIVGDGYLRKELEQMAGNSVRFFGYVSEKEKINLLSKAWVLVNPSIREGWGITIIEANACGTPCIAYDVPGLRDSIVDGKTGLLVKENSDVESLAKTVIEFLENIKLRQKFSKNALEWSKKFTWDKGAEEFIRVLESVTR